MPRIFDNIEKDLLPALQETIKLSDRADFCVGYFNLRGWRQMNSFSLTNGPEVMVIAVVFLLECRGLPADDLRTAMSLGRQPGGMDNQTASAKKKRLVEEFRDQLTIGIPTNEMRQACAGLQPR